MMKRFGTLFEIILMVIGLLLVAFELIFFIYKHRCI